MGDGQETGGSPTFPPFKLFPRSLYLKHNNVFSSKGSTRREELNETLAKINSLSFSSASVGVGGGKSMIVEDAERLRGWLTAILQPLCDADPAALAKYVLALIKKDKPEKELRQNMSDQLDVFLQGETTTFIDRLFELLRTKEYLSKPPPAIPPKEDLSTISSTSTLVSSGSPSSTSNVTPSINTTAISGIDSTSITSSSGEQGNDVTMTSCSEVVDISDTGKTGTNTNAINPSTNANATTSPIAPAGGTSNAVKRDRKEDDRDRNRRRRSRSPVVRRRGGRSRSRNRDNPRDKKYHPRKNWRSGRRNSRSRSPFRSNSLGRNRSRSPGRYRRHGAASRSRSRSPKNSASGVPRSPGAGPGNARDKGDHVRDRSDGSKEGGEKPVQLQSVIVKAGVSPDKVEKGTRCRDFDEQGLCMRGELCPFDHGNDPVVLEDIVIPGVTVGQYNHAHPGDAYGAGILRPGMPGMGEYYPDNPGMDWGMQFRPRLGFDPMMRGRPMMPRPMGPFPPPAAHRDLISVPVMGMPMDPLGQPMGMHPRGMHMRRGRGRGFDHSRLGFKIARSYANCALEVKKIPREHNNIMDLNSHFQKFGKIVNIQINFESDPEAALVTFSLPAEAQAAYRSTEAVLNNRFIRVFWHSKEKENEEASEESGIGRDAITFNTIEAELMDDQMSQTQEKVLVSGDNITKTVYNPQMLANKKTDAATDKIQAIEAIKKSQELLAAQETLKKKKEEKKKEAIKIMGDVRKRKQELLDEQLKSQKKLISKLETGKNTMKPEEITECMNVIKSIQVSMEKLKKDLEDTATLPPASVDEIEKELLDTELELYAREQEGGDTIPLHKKMSDLRAKARALGYRGRGGFRGSLRGFSPRGGRM